MMASTDTMLGRQRPEPALIPGPVALPYRRENLERSRNMLSNNILRRRNLTVINVNDDQRIENRNPFHPNPGISAQDSFQRLATYLKAQNLTFSLTRVS